MHVGIPSGNHTVRQVLDAYWQRAQNNRAEETCKSRKGPLHVFGKSVPAYPQTSRLRNFVPTTSSGGLTAIADMPKPSRVVRQGFLPADMWQQVLDLCADQEFRDYLTMMLCVLVHRELEFCSLGVSE